MATLKHDLVIPAGTAFGPAPLRRSYGADMVECDIALNRDHTMTVTVDADAPIFAAVRGRDDFVSGLRVLDELWLCLDDDHTERGVRRRRALEGCIRSLEATYYTIFGETPPRPRRRLR